MRLGEILDLIGFHKIYVIDNSDVDGDVLFAGLNIAMPPEMRRYQVKAMFAYDSALFIDVVVPE